MTGRRDLVKLEMIDGSQVFDFGIGGIGRSCGMGIAVEVCVWRGGDGGFERSIIRFSGFVFVRQRVLDRMHIQRPAQVSFESTSVQHKLKI